MPFLRPLTALALGALCLPPVSAHAQTSREVGKLYAGFCAGCHGAQLQGGSAPALLGEWKYGGDDASLARMIHDGRPDTGMPSFKDGLSDAEIRGLVVFIREQGARAERDKTTYARPAENLIAQSELYSYRLETMTAGLREPWSVAWLPDGRALVTEKEGRLRLIEKNGDLVAKPVTGLPPIDSRGQAGLFDVALHPDYARNGWIYLAFADLAKNDQDKPVSLTVILRGRLRDGAFADQEVIFRAPLEFYRPAGGPHFGGRITFDEKGYLYFSIGERGVQQNAQDLTRPNGKVHRLHDDGRVPADNPFVGQPGAIGSIWSYGNRNPQGLVYDRATGRLWETEHGPRGGDELNLIRKGLNYGWPVITYGMNYNGTPMTDLTAKDGLEQPVVWWTPSIAVSSVNLYQGNLFPKWKGNLVVASLAAQELRRLELKDDRVVHQEILFKGIGRLRDALTGPDGSLVILLPDRISRLVPAQP